MFEEGVGVEADLVTSGVLEACAVIFAAGVELAALAGWAGTGVIVALDRD